MRIFYAGYPSPTTGLASTLWRENLYRALVRLGHDVVEFQYDLRAVFHNLDPSDPAQREFIARERPLTSAALLRQIRAEHGRRRFDLFFSYFYDACVLPETIDEIRAMGIRTVNWFCNASYQLHLVSTLSPKYDWCLTPERFRIPDFEALGANPIYCQMAANPEIYRPHDVPLEFDATFVGQAYGDRALWVRHLLDQGIDVRVWGPRWIEHGRTTLPEQAARFLRRAARAPRAGLRRTLRAASGYAPARGDAAAPPTSSRARARLPDEILGAPLPDEEMIQLYSRSRVNLGFSAVGDTGTLGRPLLQVRLRDFEVPMSGGFYITEKIDELEGFYDIGREIVVYQGKEDLAEKVRWYLDHDEERERVRAAGHRRARAEHTWERRFSEAFLKMGLP